MKILDSVKCSKMHDILEDENIGGLIAIILARDIKMIKYADFLVIIE